MVTRDAEGRGPALIQGMKVLGTEQIAFDAEVAAIEWFNRRLQVLLETSNTWDERTLSKKRLK